MTGGWKCPQCGGDIRTCRSCSAETYCPACSTCFNAGPPGQITVEEMKAALLANPGIIEGC